MFNFKQYRLKRSRQWLFHKVRKGKYYIHCPYCDNWFLWFRSPGGHGQKPRFCWRYECQKKHKYLHSGKPNAKRKLLIKTNDHRSGDTANQKDNRSIS